MEHDSRRRPSLVVIADDITGAFDTGVQFSKRGSVVRFATADKVGERVFASDVVIIDAETRHLTPREAYEQTSRLVSWTIEQGIEYLYIKTDSGLRGNIGAALHAALDGSKESLIAYAPAYPAMDRITRNGQQWIDGIPIQDSVFGSDLFEPVHTPFIRDLIEPEGIEVREMPRDSLYDTKVDAPTVAVFDVETDEDFARIIRHLRDHGQLKLLAGCAGFASALSGALGLPDQNCGRPEIEGPLLVLCGSLNPITKRQIEYGQMIGYTRIVVTPKQLFEMDGHQMEQEPVWLSNILRLIRRGEPILLDTGFGRFESDDDFPGMTKEEIRAGIAAKLGELLMYLLEADGIELYTPMIIGGDTLMGFINRIEELDVALEGEINTGVVVFSVKTRGKNVRMISKSGGLGSETLLGDVLYKRGSVDEAMAR